MLLSELLPVQTFTFQQFGISINISINISEKYYLLVRILLSVYAHVFVLYVFDAQMPNMSTSCNWSAQWEILDLISGARNSLRNLPATRFCICRCFYAPISDPPRSNALHPGLALHHLASIGPQIWANLSKIYSGLCWNIFCNFQQFVCAWVEVCKVEELDRVSIHQQTSAWIQRTSSRLHFAPKIQSNIWHFNNQH